MNRNKLKYLLIIFAVLIITGPILGNWYSLVRFDPPNIGPFSVLQVIRGIFFVILLVMLSKYIPKSVKAIPLIKPILAMSIFLFVLMPFHQTPLENSVYIFQMLYASMFLVGGFVIGYYHKYANEWITKVAIISLFVIIILQLYGYIEGYRPSYSEYGFAGLGRTQVNAIALAAIIPILILRIYNMRNYDWLFLSIALLALTMTMRRGEVLAVLIGIIAATFVIIKYQKYYGNKILSRLFVVFIILVGIGYGIAISPVAEDYKKRIDDMVISEGGTGSGRLIFWAAGLKSSVDRSETSQFFGDGIGNVSHIVGQYRGRPIYAHNVWIEILIASGIIGVLILVWYHYELFNVVGKVFNTSKPSVIMAIMLIIVYGIFQGEIFSPSLAPLYAFMGITLGIWKSAYYDNYLSNNLSKLNNNK